MRRLTLCLAIALLVATPPAQTAVARPWGDPAVVASILSEAGEEGDAVHLSVQPLLVRQGDRVVLIDTGAGGQMGTQNGLPGALSAAGVDPAEVTDILISHAHGDHIGGLANAEGALAFPNAVIRMSAPEWRAMQAGAAAVCVIRPRHGPGAPGGSRGKVQGLQAGRAPEKSRTDGASLAIPRQ